MGLESVILLSGSSPTGIGLGITWGCPGLGSPPGWARRPPAWLPARGPAQTIPWREGGSRGTRTRGAARAERGGGRGPSTAVAAGPHLTCSRHVTAIRCQEPPPAAQSSGDCYPDRRPAGQAQEFVGVHNHARVGVWQALNGLRPAGRRL